MSNIIRHNTMRDIGGLIAGRRNSNTTTIRRRGRIDDELIGTAGTPVYGVTDDMTLTYDGNRLVSVSDSGTGGTRSDSYDFHDGADESVEYTYDEAGRLISDLNCGITSIVWNAASQPSPAAYRHTPTRRIG